MGVADFYPLRSESYARMKEFIRRSTHVSFRRFLWDVRREFIQLLSVILYGTLGSYLRDALEEGGAIVVTCLPAQRAQALCMFSFLRLC
jgi:hypothetical protein